MTNFDSLKELQRSYKVEKILLKPSIYKGFKILYYWVGVKKVNKIKLILLIIFLVSCGSGSSDKSPEPFNFVIEAVNEAYDYSLIEIKADSPSSILSLQLISDDLTLISSNNSTLSVLLPIVFSDTLFEYQVKAINSSGISTTVRKTILVKVYPHGIENYSLLGQTDTENFLTNDYAVFNFSF